MIRKPNACAFSLKLTKQLVVAWWQIKNFIVAQLKLVLFTCDWRSALTLTKLNELGTALFGSTIP